MELEHYLFAFYVFILVCAVILLSKLMFSDGRRQKKTLEEMESKLLRAYETLETATDEFYDLVAASKEELEQKTRALEAALLAGATTREGTGAPSVTAPIRMHGARSAASGAHPFAQLYNEVAARTELPASPLHEKILTLSKEGASQTEIAEQLQITQNEVGLVIGMYSGK